MRMCKSVSKPENIIILQNSRLNPLTSLLPQGNGQKASQLILCSSSFFFDLSYFFEIDQGKVMGSNGSKTKTKLGKGKIR